MGGAHLQPYFHRIRPPVFAIIFHRCAVGIAAQAFEHQATGAARQLQQLALSVIEQARFKGDFATGLYPLVALAKRFGSGCL